MVVSGELIVVLGLRLGRAGSRLRLRLTLLLVLKLLGTAAFLVTANLGLSVFDKPLGVGLGKVDRGNTSGVVLVSC